ncbi:large subunit ribosomal protein L9 [Entomortierella parvispora]|uniref:50S ribosomal protein L9, chloroplastic n=1 Tax=Entomortierella parvispora TaxID=205924 RepID=A0A9P3HDP7_9FUNG|nr:large subunit ribosomal protein L9 [Entomortierella parvispora]
MFSASRSSLTGTIRSATHVVKRWKSIEVTLRANVEGLGKPGDVVNVSAGRMRNRLYPFRLANYIDKNAQNFRQAAEADKNAAQTAQEMNKVYQQTIKKEQRILQLQELRNRLQALPALTFSRAVNEVLPGSKTIFGSVQAEDVIKELKEKHGIVVDKVTVNGTKIKSIGDSWARVDLGDLGTVELKVVVERR